ncbi:synaptonemal complex protein, putative [Entamoeba dispar SAW760]|uniref:Synaptonemal complex protein, putative n=1 Tax=Entamoeba dispar (strain ATCC PRA-260 / SAW760) TaxID=370354 RepID=B0EH13_ENTDS|nr:synaptonemal complex protein, putative [Entamoeba dispar SAW760]EDR26181.1 synaptonemal complex protein, putative [Entamoeba dispar SAW760]|eukprot:EDR26181.1 synaptonemal complex protein, putative [Entamoeba dispar SAW760]
MQTPPYLVGVTGIQNPVNSTQVVSINLTPQTITDYGISNLHVKINRDLNDSQSELKPILPSLDTFQSASSPIKEIKIEQRPSVQKIESEQKITQTNEGENKPKNEVVEAIKEEEFSYEHNEENETNPEQKETDVTKKLIKKITKRKKKVTKKDNQECKEQDNNHIINEEQNERSTEDITKTKKIAKKRIVKAKTIQKEGKEEEKEQNEMKDNTETKTNKEKKKPKKVVKKEDKKEIQKMDELCVSKQEEKKINEIKTELHSVDDKGIVEKIGQENIEKTKELLKEEIKQLEVNETAKRIKETTENESLKKKRINPQIVDPKEIQQIEEENIKEEENVPKEIKLVEPMEEEIQDLDIAQGLDSRMFSIDIEIGKDKQIHVDKEFKKWLEQQNISMYGEGWAAKFKEENDEVDVKGVENEEEEEEDSETIDTNKEDIIGEEEDFEETRKKAEERKGRRENPYTSVIGKLQQKLFVQKKSTRGYGYDLADNFIDDDYAYSLPRCTVRPEIRIENAEKVQRLTAKRQALKLKKVEEKEEKTNEEQEKETLNDENRSEDKEETTGSQEKKKKGQKTTL